MKNKGQEEIVGFVVVVALVAIVFVVFLGFSFSNKVQEKNSKDIKQFLESIRQVTSSCIMSGRAVSFKELFGYCYDNKICDSGEETCKILEDESKELLKESYAVGDEAYIKGYSFKIEYEEKIKEEREEIINLNQGNCSSSYREADDFFPYSSGQVFNSLRLCY